nr:MAG TPA: hypothetical protein [Caudoviricetes sp.]
MCLLINLSDTQLNKCFYTHPCGGYFTKRW